MKTVNLITCGNTMEAHIIKGRLNNEGIECFLTNENFTNLMPMYNNMLGSGIQIVINEEDFLKASEIIKDKLEPDNTKIVCPYCGSTEINLGIGKYKGLKILNIIIAFLMLIPIGNLKPNYYCKNCNEEIK